MKDQSKLTGWIATAAIAVVVVAVVVVGVIFVAGGASADTEKCSTDGEFQQIDRGMSVGTVQRIFDVQGNYVDPDGGHFKYRFRSCDDETRFVVVFSENTGLSVDKYRVALD